jgi:alkanesulfonate monooxygenase SsuD/methylene tetrahydromethanopterin reductase-like flavin-dependent oxidoreductase (luciferase family)
MGATLDVISHGRSIMGIGAGWHREEFDAYGYAFETAAARGAQLEEAAQVVRAMLSQQRTTFAGRYYRVTEACNEPRPLQRPHPPLLIGGNGEKVTLRVVAPVRRHVQPHGHARRGAAALGDPARALPGGGPAL